jgi:hypothetical protein
MDFDLGIPTPAIAARLYQQMDLQTATICYRWAIPITGMESARAALIANAGAQNGDLVRVQGFRDVSTLLGSNVTTPYLFAWFDLSDGPTTLDYPAGASAGSLIDWWDRPIIDLGIPGPDAGNGITYTLIGPNQMPPSRGQVLQSRTNRILLFCRILESDPQKAEAIFTAARVHQNGRPTTLRRFKPQGPLTTMAHPTGLAYWSCLATALPFTPTEPRDQFFTEMLQSLGVYPFAPNQQQTEILTQAATLAEAMLRAEAFAKRAPEMRYRPDTTWEYLIPPDFDVDQSRPQLAARTAFFYEVTGASHAVLTRKPGIGSAYLTTYRDANGSALDGGRPYRLRVPPNPPARLFWSVTLYDIETRCLIQNQAERADRSSRDKLIRNPDGSVDLIFAPTAPAGLEPNWIPTTPNRAWYAYFRLFGPLEPYFDRTWSLPAIISFSSIHSNPLPPEPVP